jgi:proteasome lid subunit RPN8/RPN11
MKNKVIKKDLTEAIRKARKTARNGGREIAGLLIHNGHFMELLEIRNTYRKGGHFQFDEKQIKTIMKAVKELGHRIVGTFHSHPAYIAKPGEGDIRAAVEDSLMLVIDCIGSEARLWRIKGGKARSVNMEILDV